MFSSMFKRMPTSLHQRRSLATLVVKTTKTIEKWVSFEYLTTSEFNSVHGRIWENDEHACLNPHAQQYIKDKIYRTGNMVRGGGDVEGAVVSLRQSIEGLLVPPATSSPFLKHYTSFMDKLDNFTDLRNIPDECKSLFLRKGFEYLYVHPLLSDLMNRTRSSFSCLNGTKWEPEIEVTGSANTSPGLITTSLTRTSEYYNMCSTKNDPERYHYLGSDLSGIKNELIKTSFRLMENAPTDYRFVEPYEVLKVYHNHSGFYLEGELKSPVVFILPKELHEDLGHVLLDNWEYGVGRGNLDFVRS